MERAALVYDGDCGLCRVSLGLVLAWDRRRRVRPVALQDQEAERLLAGMPEDERMASWHLVTPDGERRSAGAAFEPLLRLLPGGAPLAPLAGRFPGAAERGYRFVANRRSKIGPSLPGALRSWADRRIRAHGD